MSLQDPAILSEDGLLSLKPVVGAFLNSLPHHISRTTLEQRKFLLSFCRFQCRPSEAKILMNDSDIFGQIFFLRGTTPVTFLEFTHQFLHLFEGNSIAFAYLSSLLRCLPFDNYQEVERAARLESLVKEFEASTGPDRPQVLDYTQLATDDWLHPGMGGVIIPNIGFSPQLAKIVYQARKNIRSTAQLQTTRILVPRLSRKSMASRSTSINEEVLRFDESEFGTSKMSSRDFEMFRSHGGLLSYSPWVEMRQAWKFNDLKPRTYFAYGSLTHQISSYLQEFFNDLLDSMPSTHRRTRFELKELHIEENDEIFIYDYSSFTSNMTEQKYFLRFLGNLLKGVHVKCLDFQEGVSIRCLGEMIEEYTSVCNDGNTPCYMGEGFPSEMLDDVEFIHSKAGYLGIHGNLASCHFLHGLVAGLLTRGDYRAKIVGDDGLLVLTRDPAADTSYSGVVPLLKLLGDFAMRKTMRSALDHPDGMCYIKRPVTRVGNSLHIGLLPTLPNYALIRPFDDTTRKFDFNPSNPHERYSRLSNQFAVFRQFLHETYTPEDHEELAVAYWYLEHCYFFIDSFPRRGLLDNKSWLPGHPNLFRYLPTLPPKQSYVLLAEDPLLYTISQLGVRSIRMPKYCHMGEAFFSEQSRYETIVGNSSWENDTLADFGYCQRSMVMEEYWWEGVAESVSMFIQSSELIVYEYSRFCDLPLWYTSYREFL